MQEMEELLQMSHHNLAQAHFDLQRAYAHLSAEHAQLAKGNLEVSLAYAMLKQAHPQPPK